MQTSGILEQYAAPINQRRQANALASMQAQQTQGNALAQMMMQAQQGQAQYNALAQNGGPTRAAAAQANGLSAGPYASLNLGGGSTISMGTRAANRPTAGITNVSLDFNASESGTARGVEVIIPDNASPEVRSAAEAYVQRVADFARASGITDYPIRGVRTRSENGRGVSHTVHTEPFFNNDLEMQQAVKSNPQAFAQIYKDTFGGVPSSRIIPPHGVGKDRGAASSVFGDETSFGELMIRQMLASKGGGGK